MYKVLIVDDEQIEVTSLKLKIHRSFESKIYCSEASNGIEAIELARTNTPDIVLMDLLMPQIDGIETIQRMKAFNPNAVYIIITAISSFDYAQKALSIGVEDYLIKPAKTDDLVHVINKAIEIIDNRREQASKHDEIKQKMASIIPFVNMELISSIMTGVIDERKIQNYLSYINWNAKSSYCMIVKACENNEAKGVENELYNQSKTVNFIKELVESMSECLVAQTGIDTVVAVLPVGGEALDEYKLRAWSISFASFIYENVEEKMNSKTVIGIGNFYDDFTQMHRSYLEAVSCLDIELEIGAIRHIGDLTLPKRKSDEYPSSAEKSLVGAIVKADRYIAMESQAKIVAWTEKNTAELSAKKQRIIELVIVIHRAISDSYENFFDEYERLAKYYFSIIEAKDAQRLYDWLSHHIGTLINEVSAYRRNRMDLTVNRAKEYLTSNYMNDVTLEKVANKLNVSIYYLSRIFKRETGKSFIDYLTQIRMNEAKRLLKETDMSIKEITYKAGYNNQTYFSTVFKKETGVSASDFRKDL